MKFKDFAKQRAAETKANRIVKVDVPGWDIPIYVKKMTAKEKDSWIISQQLVVGAHRQVDGKPVDVDKNYKLFMENNRARYLNQVLCEENGDSIGDDELAEIIGDLPDEEVDILYQAALEVNNANKKSIENVEKN